MRCAIKFVHEWRGVAVWPCGCGCVAVWLCGCVAVRLCGCVAVRLCGCVAVWLCVLCFGVRCACSQTRALPNVCVRVVIVFGCTRKFSAQAERNAQRGS
jgi:hypothetical protein